MLIDAILGGSPRMPMLSLSAMNLRNFDRFECLAPSRLRGYAHLTLNAG